MFISQKYCDLVAGAVFRLEDIAGCKERIRNQSFYGFKGRERLLNNDSSSFLILHACIGTSQLFVI